MSYFVKDCLPIVDSALDDVETFARVAVFVELTIQQMFVVMPQQMEGVARDGRDSPYLFGSKRAGYDYIQAHKRALQSYARQCKAGQISLDRLIVEYLAIPGLGLAKTNFLAQMTVGDGACLDRHNLVNLGLPQDLFKSCNGLKPATVLHKVETYRAIWQAKGDSAYWWDSWCDYVAARRPTWFANGAAASAIHRIVLDKESVCSNYSV